MKLNRRMLLKPSAIVIFLVSLFLQGISQTVLDSNTCGLRISLLTCGTGSELYASYGHSALRIVDTCHRQDIVYNYGTFSFSDPDFYSKFTRGKLPYYLASESYDGFMEIYQEEGRSVTEQVLRLKPEDALVVQHFLYENLKEENKYYRYDFLYDNCSTRIRDLFDKQFAHRIEWGPIIANDSLPFRTVLDYYERNLHWERFGINLLMSDLVDRKMTSMQSMFLPDYLEKGFDKATLDGNKLVGEKQDLLPQGHASEIPLNEPKWYLWGLLLVIVLLSRFEKLRPLLVYFDVLLFMILGLLGMLMLFMWLGTEHKVCAWNRNLLWAFPLHVVFAALIPTKKEMVSRYAKYASWLLVVAVLYSFFAEQKYMPEIFPLLILIYLRLGKYSKQVKYLAFNQ